MLDHAVARGGLSPRPGGGGGSTGVGRGPPGGSVGPWETHLCHRLRQAEAIPYFSQHDRWQGGW